ncbi:MAG: hypothetical protein ACLRX4_08275 [Oscillospiraceae bacterium]
MTLIYKVLGHGTEAMTGMAVGTALDVLTGLGNGFDLSRSGEHPCWWAAAWVSRRCMALPSG